MEINWTSFGSEKNTFGARKVQMPRHFEEAAACAKKAILVPERSKKPQLSEKAAAFGGQKAAAF